MSLALGPGGAPSCVGLRSQEAEDGTLVSNSTGIHDLEAQAAVLAAAEEVQMVKDFRRNLDYNMKKVPPHPPLPDTCNNCRCSRMSSWGELVLILEIAKFR